MLTDTEIRKAKAKIAPYQMTDGHGLFLWVTPSGGKLWRWKYRFRGVGKQMSYGQYPDVSLVHARERHAEARKLLAAGADPMAKRKADKAALMAAVGNSFQAVSHLWLEHWKLGLTERHAETTTTRLEANVYLSRYWPIAEIEAPEIVAMVKTIEPRGAADLAKRALETTGQIFRYAIAHGHCKRNPATDIRPGDVLKSTRKVNMARVNAAELPALLKAIEVYRGKVVTRLAMKLMALTFVRTSELIGARWDEFDLEMRRWNIPANRMKMRAATPHRLPATQTIELLELLRAVTGGGELLFPGDVDHRKPMSNNTILVYRMHRAFKGRLDSPRVSRGLASTISLHEQGSTPTSYI